MACFCASHRVVICVTSLQKRLGFTTKDADSSAVWLTRDQFGMTFLDQLGLMDMSVILELSKVEIEGSDSRRSAHGAKILRVRGLNIGHESTPFSFSFLDKRVSGA